MTEQTTKKSEYIFSKGWKHIMQYPAGKIVQCGIVLNIAGW